MFRLAKQSIGRLAFAPPSLPAWTATPVFRHFSVEAAAPADAAPPAGDDLTSRPPEVCLSVGVVAAVAGGLPPGGLFSSGSYTFALSRIVCGDGCADAGRTGNSSRVLGLLLLLTSCCLSRIVLTRSRVPLGFRNLHTSSCLA